MKTKFPFNKRLTALALLIVTSVGGAMLAVKNASAQDSAQEAESRRGRDVTLWDSTNYGGASFDSNRAVADLKLRGFNDRASSITVNNNQTWRFYRHKNFKGPFIEIGPGESHERIGRLNNQVSSFRVVRGRW
jgi:Beta/Gamma crystallin